MINYQELNGLSQQFESNWKGSDRERLDLESSCWHFLIYFPALLIFNLWVSCSSSIAKNACWFSSPSYFYFVLIRLKQGYINIHYCLLRTFYAASSEDAYSFCYEAVLWLWTCCNSYESTLYPPFNAPTITIKMYIKEPRFRHKRDQYVDVMRSLT